MVNCFEGGKFVPGRVRLCTNVLQSLAGIEADDVVLGRFICVHT